MIKAMETRPCEARVKEWELFCLEEAEESLQNPAAERNHANAHQPRRSLHPQFSPRGATGRTTNGSQGWCTYYTPGFLLRASCGYLFPSSLRSWDSPCLRRKPSGEVM